MLTEALEIQKNTKKKDGQHAAILNLSTRLKDFSFA